MMNSLEPAAIAARLHAAEGMARALGVVALRYFHDRSLMRTAMKGYQDWLTEADGTVEKTFRTMIAEAFPGDAVMGEEQGGEAANRLWIIDPIDGTANFARGELHWCISIGFVLDGVPTLGVLFAPALGEMWTARKGHGAMLDGKPIRVAETTDIRLASIEAGWSPRRSTEDYLATVARLFARGASVKRCASGALGLAHVANGRTDAYVEAHINSWDVAAGLVIAGEAGAVLNDFCSGNWVLEGNPILCVAPGIAEEVAEQTRINLKR